jgi:mannose-6-phosphate isomerase class I
MPEAFLCYIDVPKNEIQYRSRAGEVRNLGMKSPIPPKEQYKRMYFVDWPVLNRHKEMLLPMIDVIIDDQFSEQVTWCTGNTFRSGLVSMSQHAFRVRPWFEPGVWGGDWIMNRIERLNRDVVNYAWSFECIVPENGIVMVKNGVRLECSFDFLMYSDAGAILGDSAKVFGTEFPIRFDFLDTFNGQNLSLQCHPNPDFIRTAFGETFTQDETYYMLDAAPDAKVYLGFQEDIEPRRFESELKRSVQTGEPMDVERYVQVHQAKKHDLFLIPHGTVHCSGKNGLVLEISSTPYIFTFKMYDWMRLDLDGNPRPLNIDRAMKNLDFSCKGSKVKKEYISTQEVIDEGPDWQVYQLSTHPKHFYEVYRIEFSTVFTLEDNDKGHVMSLVEGNQIEVITGGRSMLVNYAETFIIPADAMQINFRNKGMGRAKVVRASVKPDFELL